MSTLLTMVAGYLLDGLIGDPPGWPHPVRAIGGLIAAGERRLNLGTPAERLLRGGLLTAVVMLVTGLAAWVLVVVPTLVHPNLGFVVSALGVAVLLARRSLAQEAGDAVYEPLAKGDLEGARLAVSRVVGRDTAHLDESEVVRAAVETIAESASDGVVAPLFYGLLFGLPGIAIYKAVNTLDSMIGHRDERYEYFGRIAARVDDLANWLPARLTMLAIVAAAALQRREAAAGLRVAWGEARFHASPNAGWPEAAMAGAMGLRLGGVNHYDGEPHAGAVFHTGGQPPAAAHLPETVSLMNLACHILLLTGALLRLALAP